MVITKGLRASSPVYDYMYRPLKYTNMSLYDWVQQLKKRREVLKKYTNWLLILNPQMNMMMMK